MCGLVQVCRTDILKGNIPVDSCWILKVQYEGYYQLFVCTKDVADVALPIISMLSVVRCVKLIHIDYYE